MTMNYTDGYCEDECCDRTLEFTGNGAYAKTIKRQFFFIVTCLECKVFKS